MANLKLLPVSERKYTPAELGSKGMLWYLDGFRMQGKQRTRDDAWRWAREHRENRKKPLSYSQAMDAHKFFLAGWADAEKARDLAAEKRAKKNPGEVPEWIAARAVRVIRDKSGRAVRLDIKR